jgi:hypothetical protein
MIGIMTKNKKSRPAKGSEPGHFAIGKDAFVKISEVEGIRMPSAMKKRANDARLKNLSAEEYRQTIIRSYRKD